VLFRSIGDIYEAILSTALEDQSHHYEAEPVRIMRSAELLDYCIVKHT